MRQDRTASRPAAAPVLGPPPVPRVPEPYRTTLGNGLRVVALPRPEVPQVVLRLVLPAGAAADPDTAPGTASLVGSLLTEGTERRDGEALNEALDTLGAAVSTHVAHDYAEVEAAFLTETLPAGLDLLAELVSRPSFPPHEVERARAETLDMLDAREDEPANLAEDRLSELLYGPGHPYGRLAIGSRSGVAGVSVEALGAFHAARYRPEGSFLVVSGAFEPEELTAALGVAFAGWRGRAGRVGIPHVPAGAAPGRRDVPWEDAAQAEIRVGGIGLRRASPDWIAAGVANYILGGSTITGRLGANLREDKGWTYGVRSAFSSGAEPAGWAVETAVDVEVAEDALREILVEIGRMVREPVAEEELRRAKDALVLSLPRAFETPSRVVSRFATLDAYDLPRDYWERFPAEVERVTADEVRRVCAAYLHPDRLARVVVGSPPGR